MTANGFPTLEVLSLQQATGDNGDKNQRNKSQVPFLSMCLFIDPADSLLQV